jgi:hypothetical protein
MAKDSEWLWLKLAAEPIGAARLLPAWREGALRGVPSEAIVREVMRIGAAKLQQAWLEGMLLLRGVPHAIPETREVVDIPASEAGRLVLDCSRNYLVRLSSRGRRRRIEYHSVQAKAADAERLEREAKPPPPEVDHEKKAARKEAARARLASAANRVSSSIIASMKPRTRERIPSSIASNQLSKSKRSAATPASFMVSFLMAWSPFRRVNAGITWVRKPGGYASPIPTTSATGPVT